MRPRVALLLPFVFLLTACFAAFPVPGNKEGETKYVFQSGDIEILGPVSMTGEVIAFLGYFIVGQDDFGYVALVNKARRELGADSVIDVSVDRHSLTFLGLFFGKLEWRATGTAIRYRDSLRAKPTPVAPSPATAMQQATGSTTAPSALTMLPAGTPPATQQAPAEGRGPGGGAKVETPRGFSFGLRGAYGFPSGSYGTIKETGTDIDYADVFESQIVPAWIDVGYRFDEHHYVGLYGSLGLPKRPCDFSYTSVTATTLAISNLKTTISDCETLAWRAGANWQYRIPISAGLAPWFGVGAGAEIVTFEHKVNSRLTDLNVEIEDRKDTGHLAGMEVNLQAGLDFIAAGSFGFGPFVTLSAAQYLARETPNSFTGAKSNGFHYWVFTGVRVVNR